MTYQSNNTSVKKAASLFLPFLIATLLSACSSNNASHQVYDNADHNDLLVDANTGKSHRNLYDHGYDNDFSYQNYDNDQTYKAYHNPGEVEYIDNSYSSYQPPAEETYATDNDTVYTTYKSPQAYYSNVDSEYVAPVTPQVTTPPPSPKVNLKAEPKKNTVVVVTPPTPTRRYEDNDSSYQSYTSGSTKDADDEYYPLYTYDNQGNIIVEDNSRGLYAPFNTNNAVPYPEQDEHEKMATDFYDYQY